jgi:L-fuconate dehydratase
MPTITKLSVRDIRFPTSRSLDGSDAMNAAPDYSATYVTLETDSPRGLTGHGLTFTIGRGNEICVSAVKALSPLVVGKTLEDIAANMGAFWDLWAKSEGKTVWKLLVDMSPEALVRCLDFRYVTDAITPNEAIALLHRHAKTRGEREKEMLAHGYPAYTTSAGWLGYDDDKIRRLAREGVAQGWTHFKQKVGGNIEEDMRRARILREEIGEDRKLMMDANQVWEVDEAVLNMRRLAEFDPWWIEEPTSPDDVLGHATIRQRIRPIGVATGEHCQNRVMFKQLLQAQAIDFCQVDSCRLGGLNEVIVVLLMAAKFGVPVCPHAGGVGLCEYVQHISLFDYICVSASLENRVLEYVDHLHEHFVDPVVIQNGRYMPPQRPGYSIEMHAASLDEYDFPDGPAWRP